MLETVSKNYEYGLRTTERDMNNYQTEFPDFDLDVAIPAAWDDTSWHNDACPSWCAGLTKEGYSVKVWVDYADKPHFSGYELLEGGRFVVDIEDDGYIVQDADSYEGNDWDEVLAFVAAHVSGEND